MAYMVEGTIEIPMEDFWAFVEQYAPVKGTETAYGPPRIMAGDDCLRIDFAAGSDSDPRSWANSPRCLKQWKELERQK